MRRIACVTGATGFIGKVLVRELMKADFAVRVLSRKTPKSFPQGVCVFQNNLSNQTQKLEEFVDGAEVLFHCAGELHNPEQIFPVNVDGTRRLIDASRGRVRRWIQLSSIGVYGQVNKGIVDESTPVNPSNLYENSKAIADQMLLDARADHAFELTILRPSNVYGPGMSATYMHRLRNLVTKGRFFFIGPPGASATFVHVNDVVRALILCAENSQAEGQIYNLSGNDSFERLIYCIADIGGVPPPFLRLPLYPMKLLAFSLGHIPGFPLTPQRLRALTSRVVYDSSKIARELGYSPSIEIPSGLRTL